ncbi:hypothetical protein K7432_015317, partial [Basidiobolus ranarum]
MAFPSWSAFKANIKAFFLTSRFLLILITQLESLKQKNNVLEYVQNFKNILAQIIAVVEDDKIQYFFRGLSTKTRQE